MIKYFASLPLALVLSMAIAAPPPKVATGGESAVLNMPEITIFGTLPGEPKTPSTKVGCGGDCRDAVIDKKTKPVLTTTVEKNIYDVLKAAEKEFTDAAKEYAWNLEKDEEPLGGDSLIVKLAIDKLKGLLLGPVGELIDALEPTPIGLSDFDRAKSKEAIQGLRLHLENEEKSLREQRDANQKAYEENMKFLFPEISEEQINRGPASAGGLARQTRIEKSILALAKLKSDDMAIIADHVIRRSKPDAPIRLTNASIEKAKKAFQVVTPANMCWVDANQGCVLYGVKKGATCFCPHFVNQFSWVAVKGQALRKDKGQYCRSGSVRENMYEALPVGVSCRIPVDLAIDPNFPHFEYIVGKIAR